VLPQILVGRIATTQGIWARAIRISLGVGPAHIGAFVAGYGLKIVMVGAVLGLGGAGLVMRLLATQLRGVEPDDLLVYLVVTPAVLLAALVACVLPARRAARLEPWSILSSPW
jgi:putative ABC transport system permease protein